MSARTPYRLMEVIWGGLRLLTAQERRFAFTLAAAIAVVEAMQLLGMLLVVPVITLLIDENALATSRHIAELSNWLGNPTFDWLVLILAGAALALIVTAHAGSFAAQAATEIFSARCQTRLLGDVLAQCLTAPYAWFLDRNSAALTRLFQSDFTIWGREFVGSFLLVFANVVTILGGVVFVILVAPIGGLVAVALVAMIAWTVVRVVRHRLVYWTSEKRRAAERAMMALTELLAGSKDVLTSGAWRQFVAICVQRFGQMSRASVRGVIYGGVPAAALLLLAQAGLLLVLLAFWYSGSRGAALAAQMTLVILVVARVIPSLGRLTGIATRVMNAVPWVGGILDLRASLSATAHLAEKSAVAKQPVPEHWRQVRFDDVSFAYCSERRAPIDALTLVLMRDRCYGIKGASGAGKTTFVDLFLGLLDPSQGQIRIDDAPLGQIDVAEWRKRIGYVSQQPYFLDDSIKANVAFGNDVDEAKVRDCIERSGLGELVASLPLGLNTLLGDRAVAISGGQRQRIAIARALYRDPQILVLDEATASLDAATERRIGETLKNLKKRMMIVIVSHKDSTLALCDEIFVLANGRLSAARCAQPKCAQR